MKTKYIIFLVIITLTSCSNLDEDFSFNVYDGDYEFSARYTDNYIFYLSGLNDYNSETGTIVRKDIFTGDSICFYDIPVHIGSPIFDIDENGSYITKVKKINDYQSQYFLYYYPNSDTSQNTLLFSRYKWFDKISASQNYIFFAIYVKLGIFNRSTNNIIYFDDRLPGTGLISKDDIVYYVNSSYQLCSFNPENNETIILKTYEFEENVSTMWIIDNYLICLVFNNSSTGNQSLVSFNLDDINTQPRVLISDYFREKNNFTVTNNSIYMAAYEKDIFAQPSVEKNIFALSEVFPDGKTPERLINFTAEPFFLKGFYGVAKSNDTLNIFVNKHKVLKYNILNQ